MVTGSWTCVTLSTDKKFSSYSFTLLLFCCIYLCIHGLKCLQSYLHCWRWHTTLWTRSPSCSRPRWTGSKPDYPSSRKMVEHPNRKRRWHGSRGQWCPRRCRWTRNRSWVRWSLPWRRHGCECLVVFGLTIGSTGCSRSLQGSQGSSGLGPRQRGWCSSGCNLPLEDD